MLLQAPTQQTSIRWIEILCHFQVLGATSRVFGNLLPTATRLDCNG